MGPSSAKPVLDDLTPDSKSIVDEEDEDYEYIGLSDLLPVRSSVRNIESCLTSYNTQEAESPTPIPYSFSIYTPPPDSPLDLVNHRSHLILRLVGNHPLWGHHLSALLISSLPKTNSITDGILLVPCPITFSEIES